MKDEDTREQLINELSELNKRIDELESAEKKCKEVELAVQEARIYAEDIFKAVREPLVVLDAELRVISANHSFYKTFKLTPEETERRHLYELGNRWLDIPELRELLEEILSKKDASIGDFEVEEDFPSIGKRVMLLNARSIYRDANKTQMILLTIEDITERKKVEEELKRVEEKFRTIFDHTSDAIFIHDLEGHFLEVNKTTCECLGYSREELLQMTLMDIDAPEYAKLVPEKIEELKRRGHLIFEATHVTKDGRVIPIELSVRIIEFEGKPAVLGIAKDITERKMMVEELKKYERFYKNAQDMFFIIDKNGRVVSVNPKFAEMLGYDVGELIGHTSRRLLHPDEVDSVKDFFTRVLNGESLRGEFRAVAKDGRILWFELVEWPVFDNGEIIGVEGIFREVTERVKMEEELKRLNKLLVTINEINKLIVHEKDKEELLTKACIELAKLEEYYSAWIGLVDNDSIVPVAKSKTEVYIPAKINLKNSGVCCLKSVVKNKEIEVREPANHNRACPFYSLHKELTCIVIPMMMDGKVIGVNTIYSKEEKPSNKEIELLQTLANDLAFGIKAIEVDELKREAYEQIGKNIERFATLVDQIRNPLAIIVGFAELKVEDKKVSQVIIQQVERIDEVIKQLDEGWIESDKIRKFLRKY